MKQTIKNILIQLLADMSVTDVDPEVEIADVPEHGDYTTNIAMRLTKILKKPPMVIGQQIKEQLEKNDELKKAGIEKIEVMQPGFINFKISSLRLTNELEAITKEKETYGQIKQKGKQQKVMVEYTDPNPFKELHVGHLYSNAVGESLARILTFTGSEVKRSDYFGDVGMHVSKSLWGLIKKMADDKKTLSDLEALPLPERIHYLGQAYAVGSQAYEDTTEQGKKNIEDMKDINYLVYVSAQDLMKKQVGWEPQIDYAKFIETSNYTLPQISKLYQTGRTWSMEYFETIFRRLGTIFDYYYPESICGEYGAQMVKANMGSVFEKSDGAIIFRGETFGLHTRVFMNALGLPTYEAKELGLATAKYKDFPFDLSLNVTGNEINEYFKVVLTAFSKIKPELAAKIKHIGHGMVRLPQGKMSSRTGKVLTTQWLMDEVKQKVYEVLATIETTTKLADREEVAEKETIAAIKYSFLKVALPSNIAFDLDKSVSFEGDSGPYLLYTYARCKSVLEKAKNLLDQGIPRGFSAARDEIILNPEEHAVARFLFLFPDIVQETANNLAPNILCTYLFDLSQAFNLFYAKHKIIGEENEPIRLLLTQATAYILKNGLNLLGIETVERM